MGEGPCGTKPGMEEQYTDSEGRSLMAANIIFESMVLRNQRLIFSPNSDFARRADTSAYSCVLSAELVSARKETQCVEATSVGCNLCAGYSLLVRR